ncbi:hypothetical protein KW795_03085 [Candidatus Microgenomates bacterium]|nr:hypothetical protein [Candidatus Microgenomates bacterium]
MKKYLPIALFLLGLVIFAGVYFFVIKAKKVEPIEDDGEVVAEIPFDKRPFTSLTPIKDGHWLKLEIKGIKVTATSLDYELLYKTSEGATQGVPGTIKMAGTSDVERELLLGSESSGKFRYDEGVEEGTITLRFRNEKGKLVGKLASDFHLQAGDKELTSQDGKFKFVLDKAPKSEFFVTMNTFGLSGVTSVVDGPYGVFTESTLTGKPDGEWTKANSPVSTSLGVYYK